MPQIDTQAEKKVFHPQDFVLWHYRSDNHSQPVPIPGVVVRQQEDGVIIRIRVEGSIKKITVNADELVAR